MMALKGRHWVAVWLAAFLAVAWIVIGRQTSAIALARALTALRAEHANLAGHGADLERRIRAATSRSNLMRRARVSGLRLPADTEIVLLPAPTGSRADRHGEAPGRGFTVIEGALLLGLIALVGRAA